jgi:NAD dependent epimerase/dehydratase family enzyme
VVPAPEFALRLAFGEMALGTVLASQRMRPTAIERSGFTFTHRTLTAALRAVLGLA